LTIDRNAQRLQFLIEDLLSISLLESGQVRLNVRPLSLREEGDRVIEDFHSTARARDITVVDELPDLAVEGDADRFHQVLGNLLDNAIKYGRRGGHVWLRARALPERMVQLCVADDGPGIPSDALPRIFERFYRVDKARSREAGGTGLGLSIVKHIVQSHGGRVWAESELGKGASFFFTLPQV
jgi:two-component system phosphate regulon sensor histidine kinase PhoR